MKQLLFLAFVVQALLVSAQQYTQTIRGVVTDKQSQMPMSGVMVVLDDTTHFVGTITGLDGSFVLHKVPVGRVSLHCRFVGYQMVVLSNIEVTSGKETVLSISMDEIVTTAAEITITAQTKDRARNKMATISARSFTVEETERYAGSLGDPSRMAANYAGVVSASDQRNDIIIRGNSPNGLLWCIEGLDVPNPNHFGMMGSTGGPISMLNNNVLANSDFFTGAFPAEYGNALAGVFDLSLRTGNSRKREYMAQFGWNGFELGAEGYVVRKQQASYIVNYRYSAFDLIINGLGLNFGTGSAIPNYQDLTFNVNVPTRYGTFSCFGVGGTSLIELLESKNVGYAFAGGTDVYFGTRTGFSGFSHSFFLPKQTKVRWAYMIAGKAASSRGDSLTRKGVRGIFPSYRSTRTEITHQLATDIQRKINARNLIKLGINVMLTEGTYNDSVYFYPKDALVSELNESGTALLLRVYGQWQHKLSDALVFNSGVHASWFELNNSKAIEPRLGIRWNISNADVVSFGSGLHSQTQPLLTYFERFLDSTGNAIQTNKALDFTRSWHVVAGYDRLLGNDTRLKAELYYQYLFDVPVSALRPEFSLLNAGDDLGTDTYRNMTNSGSGINYGTELTLEKFFSHNYYFLFTTSLFRTTAKGYDNVQRSTVFDGGFVINALAGYELPLGNKAKFTFDIKNTWTGGKRYTPLLMEESVLANRAVWDWSNAYTRQHPDYVRLNFRTGFAWNSKYINQSIAVDLQNITNRRNVFMQRFSRLKQMLITDYQLGFFPMVTYRLQF